LINSNYNKWKTLDNHNKKTEDTNRSLEVITTEKL
jgi:hypothetical protein